MRIYLITHAHTEQDPSVDARYWHLSDQGSLQAWVLARQHFWPNIDYIVLSSEPKTALTIGQVLRERRAPVWRDARFDEVRRPGYAGNYVERVRALFANPARSAGDWESATSALQRFLSAVDNLSRQCPDCTLALVGHGLTFSLYRAHLLGQPTVEVDDWRRLTFCSAALVDPRAGELLQDFQPLAPSPPRA